MKWFRWWHGTTSDPKFGGIAIKTGETLERVLFVWAALEESASDNDDDRGSFTCDPCDIAALLHCEEDSVIAIITAFRLRDMIDGSRFTAWDKRNPARDDAAQRQRTARDKRVTVTPPGGDERKPDTDSDSDTDLSSQNASHSSRERARAPSDEGLQEEAEPLEAPEFVALADSQGLDLSHEIRRFYDYLGGQGETPADLGARFRGFLTSGKGKIVKTPRRVARVDEAATAATLEARAARDAQWLAKFMAENRSQPANLFPWSVREQLGPSFNGAETYDPLKLIGEYESRRIAIPDWLKPAQLPAGMIRTRTERAA